MVFSINHSVESLMESFFRDRKLQIEPRFAMSHLYALIMDVFPQKSTAMKLVSSDMYYIVEKFQHFWKVHKEKAPKIAFFAFCAILNSFKGYNIHIVQ